MTQRDLFQVAFFLTSHNLFSCFLKTREGVFAMLGIAGHETIERIILERNLRKISEYTSNHLRFSAACVATCLNHAFNLGTRIARYVSLARLYLIT